MLLRDPSEIPAPVAIALADFCRRADRPASSEEVREALARLSPDEDRLVRKLCKGEPPARPLSPHAVIDLIRGRPAADAARLEEQGYYGPIAEEASVEARAMAKPVAKKATEKAAAQAATAEEAAAPGPTEAEAPAENPFAPSEESQRERVREAIAAANGDFAQAADELGLEDEAALRRLAIKLGILEAMVAPSARAQKAAEETPKAKRAGKLKAASAAGPIRRTKAEAEELKAARERAAREETPEAVPTVRPGRSPATPQFGRFVVGRMQKRPWRELESGAGAGVLEELISELRANRQALVNRLDTLYVRDDGRPVAEGDLRRLLGRHGLTEWFERVERENLKGLLRQSRGFLPAVARTLGLQVGEAGALVRRHGLENDLLELKERTREEARADAPLAERILLAAEKEDQLRDAGVLDELDEWNRDELFELVEDAAEANAGVEPHVLVELTRRASAIEPRIWRKGVRRYGLLQKAADLLGVELPALPPEEERRPRRFVRAQRPERAPLPRLGGGRVGEGPQRRREFSPRGAPGGFGGEAPRRFERPAQGPGGFGGARPPRPAGGGGFRGPPSRPGGEGRPFGGGEGRPARPAGGPGFGRGPGGPRSPGGPGFGRGPGGPRSPGGPGFGRGPGGPRSPGGPGFGRGPGGPRSPGGPGFGRGPGGPRSPGGPRGGRPGRPGGPGRGPGGGKNRP